LFDAAARPGSGRMDKGNGKGAVKKNRTAHSRFYL
jgi:hypothetical protein